MITPLGHRVLVKPLKIEDEDEVLKAAKALGIEIPDATKRQEQTAVDKGVVLAVGDTAFKDFGGAPWVQVGDLIAYARYGGKSIVDPTTKEDYLILNDEDCICKFTKEEVNE